MTNQLTHMGRGGILNNFFFPEDPRKLPEPIQGTIDKAIVQGRVWRVRFNGSYWFARLYQPNQDIALNPEQTVEIVAIQGITLLIAPLESTQNPPEP